MRKFIAFQAFQERSEKVYLRCQVSDLFNTILSGKCTVLTLTYVLQTPHG